MWSCDHWQFGCTDWKDTFISAVARKALARLARADKGVICITTARLFSISAGKLIGTNNVLQKGEG